MSFFKNLEIISNLQQKNEAHVTYGVTRFADLTREEFKARYLMNMTFPEHALPREYQSNVQALPATWDWRTKGVVGPVENEGQCGSTWAFSAKEAFESVCAIAGYPLEDLSAQQIVDCDTADYGCNGGFPWTACAYIIKYGLETDASYPYTSEQGNCLYASTKVVQCKMLSWEYVTTTLNENVIQQFVYEQSPLSVCVDAETWQFYTSGVITTKSNCGTSIDHCVEMVGWTVMDGVNAWILRNQWGTAWGMNGYVYVQMGANVCGIATYPLAPCVKAPNGKTVC